ncbi:hypothetical protein COH20_007751 [Aspergillus flavus]|nr:hypothetical protein COH20_007751 [Aspergillus flavus]RAQ63244.1 hypothetical protein COH21_011027 [Aspergillus flavus]
MPPRRSHKKSRNGCDQCKNRRVKCDEADPCLNCTRRSLSCSYQPRVVTPRPEPKKKHAEQLVACTPAPGTSIAEISARTDAALKVFQRNLTDTAYFVREWNGQDPELMHHYCISTCTTLSDEEEVRHVWRTEIPKIAYSYEFLMHGILSLSALHLSYVKPEKHSHYLTSSTFHMALGLQTFRTILRKPTAENCFALFAFSSVIMVWICAVPTDSKDAQPLSSVIEMFNLCRGITTLLEFFPLINKSCLGPLMARDWSEKRGTPLRLFNGLDGQISRLRYRLTVEVLAEEERSVLEHAITELEKTCQRIEHARTLSASGILLYNNTRVPPEAMDRHAYCADCINYASRVDDMIRRTNNVRGNKQFFKYASDVSCRGHLLISKRCLRYRRAFLDDPDKFMFDIEVPSQACIAIKAC